MRYIFLALLIAIPALHAVIEVDVDYLKNEIKQNPSNISYRLILAKYYLQEGNYSRTDHYLNQIQRIDPDNTQARTLRQTMQRLQNLQSLLPKTTLSNPFEIEQALHPLVTEKKCSRFINIYQQITQAALPTTDQTRLDAALCYAYTAQPQQARLLLKINDFPDSDQLLAVKTLLALSQNNLQEAEKGYTLLKEKYPHSPYRSYVRTQIRELTQAHTRRIAAEAFEQNSLKALQDYVYLLHKQNKKQEAIDAVKTFLKKNPHHKEARILLAKLYYFNGNLDRAFHTLYPVRLTSPDTKKLYANILYEKSDYKHALYYLPSLAKQEKDPKQRYNLQKRAAFAYAYTGQKEKATRLFEKLLQQNPKDTEVLQFKNQYQNQLVLQKAVDAYRQKDLPTALDYYLRYYQQNKDPKIAKEIAEIYYVQHTFDKSLPFFRYYLNNYPNDTLIRFHYATALEKEQDYTQSAVEFAQVASDTEAKTRYLALYHQAYSLMQQQQDEPWIQARETLKNLNTELSSTDPQSYRELKKYVSALLQKAMGPVQKPTYYKDIVLTEGAKKDLNTEVVFWDVDFYSTTKPSLKTLLHIPQNRQKSKPNIILTTNYVDDTQTTYQNYQVKIANLMAVNGIRYSAVAKRYHFDFQDGTNQNGTGFFLQASHKNLTLGLGVEQFDSFNTLVPTLTWAPVYGIHTLYMELSYRNGIFTNYRQCMLTNETGVLHFGLYDRMLMDNLNYTEMGLSVNAYDDNNINIYAMVDIPVYTKNLWGIEHNIYLNENIDYNTKTDVCYQPSRLYDSTYIKYRPKVQFKNGSLTLSLGSGYSFQNQEQISSYAIRGNYTINKLATFEINCEQLQSSFTTDNVHYCTFNIIQGW